MGHPQRSSSVRKKKVKTDFPQIYVDKDSDFAAIKLAPGVEARSYEKEGFIFCEDKSGKVIEIQVLNLSDLKKRAAA